MNTGYRRDWEGDKRGKGRRGKRGLRVWGGGDSKRNKTREEEGRIAPIHRMSEGDMFIRLVQH